MKKITEKIRNEMVELREKGASYRDIMKEVGVSKWSCINYLRDVKVDRSWIEKEWRKAEKDAEYKLKEMGFTHIVNLNDISPSPYWDYYCEKNNKKWLIDVTINQHKNLVDKALREVKGYEMAVLLKKDDGWKLLEIKVKEVI